MENSARRSLEAVQRWVESHNYKGYDPGDGLSSFLRPLTFDTLLAERLLIQLVWKSPINLRPLLGVVPLDSTKGRGFMAWGYLLLYKNSKDAGLLAKAVDCLNWLEIHNDAPLSGHAWGNHFDFTTRGGRMKAHTPTVVWSGLIGQVYIAAFELTGNPHYLDMAESICRWILTLPREKTHSGCCLSYTAVSQNSVHNSNLLGAAMLAATWKYRPKELYWETARESVRYSCARQLPDGSWRYGEDPKHHWIDSFHTGYNLDSLKRYIDCTGDESFRSNLVAGLNFYKEVFFEKSGRPRYYNTSTYPIDIQCAAQAIDTFCLFASEDSSALPMARKVAKWTIEHMQAAKGYFCYRMYPFMKARTAYFHWGQATMFKALSHLLLLESESSTHVLAQARAQNGAVKQTKASPLTYVLITPARNEEALIGKTIEAILAQTVRPLRWIIVSDGSTDRTDEIVRFYASSYPWIELLRMAPHEERQFAAKANAFNAGYARLKNVPFSLLGNLDADITVAPEYFEFLLAKFASDQTLGVAGTPFVEDQSKPGEHTYSHRFAQLEHVSGACQMFRRSCFESIGGYQPVKGGAIDWIAVTTARMNGWKTKTFTEKVCYHHRAIGTGNNSPLMVRFHYGTKAYYVGGHPLWVLMRSIFQMRQKPLVLGGVFFELGYLWALIRRIPRAVPPELMAFHRSEQIARLRKSFAPRWAGSARG